jgi:hypothetical protein
MEEKIYPKILFIDQTFNISSRAGMTIHQMLIKY